jgi:hypothetical protein
MIRDEITTNGDPVHAKRFEWHHRFVEFFGGRETGGQTEGKRGGKPGDRETGGQTRETGEGNRGTDEKYPDEWITRRSTTPFLRVTFRLSPAAPSPAAPQQLPAIARPRHASVVPVR